MAGLLLYCIVDLILIAAGGILIGVVATGVMVIGIVGIAVVVVGVGMGVYQGYKWVRHFF